MVVNVLGGTLPQIEIDQYVEMLKTKYSGRTIQQLDITVDNDFVDIKTTLAPLPFYRLRRITGYLTNTLDRWCDGKRAEERDRVKHSIVEME